MKRALVICSGGLDPTTMAILKKSKGYEVDLITFDYGQKALNEITRSKVLAEKLNAKHIVIDLSNLAYIFGSKNQLTNHDVEVKDNFTGSVVVPLRNSMFVNMSYIYAMTNSYDEVVLGSHLDDMTLDDNNEYMFPDCSPEFFNAMNMAYQKGKRKEDYNTIITSASIEGYYKSDLIKLCNDINSQLMFDSWSCYLNDGIQCGTCDSCNNRKRAFEKSGIVDKTNYQVYQ
jgi:7-cyano-7-deazaguanine synthase